MDLGLKNILDHDIRLTFSYKVRWKMHLVLMVMCVTAVAAAGEYHSCTYVRNRTNKKDPTL